MKLVVVTHGSRQLHVWYPPAVRCVPLPYPPSPHPLLPDRLITPTLHPPYPADSLPTVPAVEVSATAPALSVSAPSDDAVTSPGLDSSRLSAAFGAALGAVDDTGDVSEGDIDVGSGSVALPAYGEVEGGATTGIPGVNPGTAGVAAAAGVKIKRREKAGCVNG